MKETERLHKMFEDLYAGDPWLDVTLVDTLSVLSAQQAAHKLHPNWNSIWEITNHLISWRENVLQRVKGKTIKSPEHNYFLPVSDTSEAAWQKTLEKLHEAQEDWLEFLDNMQAESLEKIYPTNELSYADHIHGIIQHDAYHLGQIVLLAKHAV
ncbi:DinB family protein [Flavobacterium sp. CYK-4]|uniref:DinB family protein n=1 Tax=Flavobacterium lotistagni TaxID=2709660 RepID=UPI00140CB04C|nr:DinB family protein [Flavobacterium lotistagni]NHM07338.1 DinB family protein [Flavobacterium lotistagni]